MPAPSPTSRTSTASRSPGTDTESGADSDASRQPLQLVWLRSDLRVHDNTALSQAAARGPVVAVVIPCYAQWMTHGHGANKLDFLRRGLHVLQQALAGHHIPLKVLDCDTFAEVPEALATLCTQLGVQALHFNDEYAVNERERDRLVRARLADSDIRLHRYTDMLAFTPGELLTGKGDYYGVFTPFSKRWHKEIDARRLALNEAPAVQDAPRDAEGREISGDAIPALPDTLSVDVEHGPSEPLEAERWPAGEDAAQERLERFMTFRARRYHEQRDLPATRGTSELSPYLALGMISARQCYAAVLAENGSLADGDVGLTTWVNELIWREFYQHILIGFPRVNRHRPFQRHTEALQWRDDDAGFAAWCEGRTGYPIVDAAMRQLVETGWMHNRLRMVTAMFLTKHLLIDWRRGEAYFLAHLVDGELGANNGGWQWAASTGTDAAPYFRIFNPTTQGQRFDKDGDFIASFVPELAELPAKRRQQPTADDCHACGYPRPIVDHKAARQRALDAFKALTRSE
ncbi:deoxyribodipyrimidine photo-lyase [Cobetia sp. 14N.309.X.WAT.E.A4]|uniref:deoxyribodipyrimidine photo-lyase n=1 Tax=Cobetia sp. 14N.309.X.WAT.E.A4 TaxID=2998323 RepID=UPI0025B1D4DC|nr:deoxyribodipyrimidine photo-lyase [Cobetia sp. 14N.309.X.WAT.E.A4]MDN2657792.1 deoxyribodipyrimidine photo-lyase [Cobetia sp. 14N.309.X.WAT.E.A4]